MMAGLLSVPTIVNTDAPPCVNTQRTPAHHCKPPMGAHLDRTSLPDMWATPTKIRITALMQYE